MGRVASGRTSGVKLLPIHYAESSKQFHTISVGLTTATTGTVVQQGTSGNYATDGQRRIQRKQRRQRGQRRKSGRRIQRLMESRKAKSVG